MATETAPALPAADATTTARIFAALVRGVGRTTDDFRFPWTYEEGPPTGIGPFVAVEWGTIIARFASDLESQLFLELARLGWDDALGSREVPPSFLRHMVIALVRVTRQLCDRGVPLPEKLPWRVRTVEGEGERLDHDETGTCLVTGLSKPDMKWLIEASKLFWLERDTLSV